MSRGNLAWLAGVPGVMVLLLAVAYAVPTRERDRDQKLLHVVGEVLAEIDQNYVKELPPDARDKLLEAMINGGLVHLDPYSGYFNEVEAKQLDKQITGRFSGIGITLGTDRDTGRAMVMSPIMDSPAYKADIRAGDLILKVDGKPTEGMNTQELMLAIGGELDTWVTITVLHEGDKQATDCRVQRKEISIPSVLADLPQGGPLEERDYSLEQDRRVAYVRLAAFSKSTTEDLARVMEAVRKKGGRGLVLDMRDNPGGLLQQAVGVSRLFVNDGLIVSIRDRHEERDRYEANQSALLLPQSRYPVAVIQNRMSASASEIVAAALQDHGRAVVVGERSFGKGSVQSEIRIPRTNPVGTLKLTTASWWRPSGKELHRAPDAKDTDDWGVRPSPGLEVALTDEERVAYARYRRDRDVIRPTGAAPKPAKPFADKMLDKAVEHLRGEIAKADQ